MRLALLSLGWLLVLAPSAHAQTVYRWEDSDGEIHYTDDKDTIPADKRKAAAVTKGGELGIAPSYSPQRKVKKGGEPEEAVAAEDTGDADERARLQQEQEWQGRFKEKRDRIDRLEKLVAADKKAVEDPNAAGLPVRRVNGRGEILPSPELDAIKKRLPGEEQDLAKAREALADLEREAASKAIPLEWRH
jgi:hypothetical protein